MPIDDAVPNQFNKRTDLWIISVTWLHYMIFDKTVLGFLGIKSIVFSL